MYDGIVISFYLLSVCSKSLVRLLKYGRAYITTFSSALNFLGKSASRYDVKLNPGPTYFHVDNLMI